jgi:hypothetical protein
MIGSGHEPVWPTLGEEPPTMSEPATPPAESDADSHTAFLAAPPSVEELAAQQGVSPVTSLDDLRADFWPEEDSVEDFAATIRRWRSEGG